jgi:hypothetical protein
VVRVGQPQHGRELGKQRVEQADLAHQSRSVGSEWPAAQRLRELLRHRGGADFTISLRWRQDRLVRVGVDREAEPARELDRPHHADRVLLEAHVGVADRAHEPHLEVVEPADPVDDREVRDVVEEAVDREVAAQRVLARRAEGVVGSLEELGAALLAGSRPGPGRRRNVATSMTLPSAKRMCASRKRRPISRQLRKSLRSAGGCASVPMSKSFGARRGAGRARCRRPGIPCSPPSAAGRAP